MKTQILLSALVLLSAMGLAQNKTNNSASNYDVSQISIIKWNTPDGLPYRQVPGANLGATSFEVMDKDRIAFLCNSTSEIIITQKTNGKAVQKFHVAFAPRDFIFENGFFYVLDESKVSVYNEFGKEINRFQFPDSYVGVERLIRFNNATYLLLPSGKSLMIEKNGNLISPQEFNGWITKAGYFVLTHLSNKNNNYTIEIRTSENSSYEKTFTAEKKIAGVFVVGASSNRIVLDVQTYISENPIAVERNLEIIELNKKGFSSNLSSIKIPDCYYVLSNKEFYLNSSGKILNMVTSPQGTFIFSLSETKSGKVNKYPASVSTIKYHFNNHLLKTEQN